MGGSNAAAAEPPLPVFVAPPAAGTAWTYDAGTALVSTVAELVQALTRPCGTKSVQLLGQTYDLTGLLPALTVVNVIMVNVSSQPTVIVGDVTLLIQANIKNVTFQGMNLELNDRVERLERVTCDGIVTSTVFSPRLTVKDCVFTGAVDFGQGEFHMIDNTFTSLMFRPHADSEVKTCIFNGPIIVESTGSVGHLSIHGALLRLPATAAGSTTMLDVTSSGVKVIISNIVVDLERVAAPAGIFNLVRLNASVADQIFLTAATFDPKPSTTSPSILSVGTGAVQMGLSTLTVAPAFSGSFTNLRLGPV